MKVKNIMFSGFAAAILMGVGAANAVVSADTYNLANTGYVDAKVAAVATEAGKKENAANKFTDSSKDAWRDAENKDVQFPTINVAERIALDSVAQISADVADLTDIRTKANKAAEDIAKLNGTAETSGSVANTIAAALAEKNYTTMGEVEAKNYLTAVPAEYVTSEELAAENYATKDNVATAKQQAIDAAAEAAKIYTTMGEVEAKNYLTAVPAEYVTSEELAAEDYATKANVATAKQEAVDAAEEAAKI